MQIRMLREIDALFSGAPQSRKTLEAKEEMLQNLMEKYNDLLAEGKSEEAAFSIALGGVGDISDLIDELRQAPPPPKVASFPEPDMSFYEDDAQAPPRATVPPRAAATPQARGESHRGATLVSTAVMLYILCPVPAVLMRGRMGVLLLLTMVAVATGMLIYYGMTSPGKKKAAKASAAMPYTDAQEQTMPPPPEYAQDGYVPQETWEAREAHEPTLSKQQRHALRSLTSALWLLIVALYFVVSFHTGAWHISWIIFLIGAAVSNVLSALFDIFRK